MRIMRVGAVAALALSMTTLGACGAGSSTPSSPADVAELAGTGWVLTSYDREGTATEPLAEQLATLSFGDSAAFSGSTGCNRFTGTYTQDGTALELTVGPLTRMACAEPAQAQEDAVLAGLDRVARALQQDGALLLQDSGGVTLLTYAEATATLQGTSWQATGINNGKGAVSSTAQTGNVSAAFADGTVSGNGGCNTYTASFTTSGTDGLSFGPVAATQMACDLLDLEQQYFEALAKVATYRIEGDTLTLRDANGSTQVTFAAA